MEYKVIKSFGIAKKGDIFKNSANDPCLFTMESMENNKYRSMSVSDDLIDTYEEHGFVIPIKQEDNVETTVKETIEFIDSLLEQYDSDLNETIRKFNNGEIQPCVKLEAETVYYNLTKVLKEIKSKLIA